MVVRVAHGGLVLRAKENTRYKNFSPGLLFTMYTTVRVSIN